MTRKERIKISPEQKLEYAKMMVENGYSVQQIREISGAGPTAVRREKNGKVSHIQKSSAPPRCNINQQL